MLAFNKLPWLALLVGALVLLDLAIHPLTAGPDRLVHDPAVYRLADANYLPGDWYTDMAVKSGIYTFYAPLVNAARFIRVPEELWRILLYLASLTTLFYALIRIARLFSPSLLIIPIVIVLHMFISTGDNQPVWLYGPFLQIDGGLAPRSIGMALSFLALFFLLRGSFLIPSAILGVATLFHASNSFIVFTLFLAAWVLETWLKSRDTWRERVSKVGRESLKGIGTYLLFGGLFALYVASLSNRGTPDFTTEKFIWSWTYLRAPYLVLPLVTKYWWIRLFTHVAAIIGGWFILRKKFKAGMERALDILILVGLGSVAYFGLFYIFAFVSPWLPGFQFYSIRVIYLAYFVAYLFIALTLVIVGREWVTKLFSRFRIDAQRYANTTVIAAIIIFLTLFGARLGDTYRKPKLANLGDSWQRILDASVVFRSSIPEEARLKPPQHTTFQFLLTNPQPFLAPPDWNKSSFYLPQTVSFKSFGFTKEGLPEWFKRLNDVSQGELGTIYEAQKESGRFKPVELEWNRVYSKLTDQDILTLASRYHFQLFLTYRSLDYPFSQVAEDSDYRLYELPTPR